MGPIRKLAAAPSPRLSPDREGRFFAGAEHASRFFKGDSDVHQALRKLASLLDGAGIPYAILSGMALNEYGYQRVTVGVDVLLTKEGLEAFKAKHLGRGYLPKFPGSKGLRDTENGVKIDVVLAGDYPGDGLPKPIAFPDPAVAAVRGERTALLRRRDRAGRPALILYLDTSSLIKLYIAEEGSPEVRQLSEQSSLLAMSVIAYPETRSALARLRREGETLAPRGA